MNEAVSSEQRGCIVNLASVAIAAIRVSDGTAYRYPVSRRLVK